MQIDPLKLTEEIKKVFNLYLDTICRTKYSYINDKLREKMDEEKEKFFKGPYVQATPNYKQGANLEDLVSEGILEQETKEIFKKEFKHSLYKHQEEVIRKVRQEKNVLVSTGTGSGKTLSFLIPVVDYIVRSGKRESGVKAIFIYPMNALANDQIEELRKFLAGTDITFARYTGDTYYTKEEFDKKRKEGEKSYKERKKECREELLVREDILSNPPDILITNYSMLEYLLLRPKESPLFEDKALKFLVLDEIHVYDGAKGAEIGCLLRRLKQRACFESPICIGASATLGGKDEEKVNEKAAKFATAIFGENFDKEDVVRAQFEDENEKDILGKIKEFISKPREFSEVQKKFSNIFPSDKELLPQLRKLQARYHFFVKAPDGVFVTLSNDGKIENLSFKMERTRNGKKVFQLATCRYCGEVFITGYINNKKNEKKLELYSGDPVGLDKVKKIFLAIPNEVTRDTLELMTKEKRKSASKCYLNVETGELSRKKKEGKNWLEVFELKEEENSVFPQPKKCPSCGVEGKKHRKGMWLSYFTPPQERPQTVLMEVLFRHLVEKSKKKEDRKIIAFSDSRRDAAFFATGYQDFNNEMWKKWLFYRNLSYEPVDKRFLEKKLKKYLEDQEDIDTVFMREFALIYDSLERIGLVKFLLPKDKEEKILERIRALRGYPISNLNKEEIKSLIYNLLAGLRENRIIRDDNEVLDYRGIIEFEDKGGRRKGGLASWIPYRRKDDSFSTNKRFHLLKRVFSETTLNDGEIVELLKEIWEILKSERVLVHHDDEYEGFVIEPHRWRVQKNRKVYVCNKCGRIHTWNVKNACTNSGCSGNLIEKSIDGVPVSKFYLNFFSDVEKGKAKNYKAIVEEHTAQLSKEEAEEIQRKFTNGDVNILSCSTTFELGVDIGALQMVFLHNVPPRPDNYVQRAGRAGRRGTNAYILTYVLNRPHDSKVFENPIKMIKGEIKPPAIKLNNRRILLRHFNAVALSYFLRKEFTGRRVFVKDFRDNDAFKKFEEFMETKPVEVKEELRNILSSLNMKEKEVKLIGNEVDLENWKWWNGKLPEDYGSNSKTLWETIEEELKEDISELEEVIKKIKLEIQKSFGDFGKVGYLSTIGKAYETYLEQIKRQDIISFFSRKVFIPKYGFPVDVVPLKIVGHKLSKKIQLDRDLKIAIREYAPGEKVVVRKHMIMPTNVRILPKKEPEIRYFFVCRKCLYFKDAWDKDKIEFTTCPACGGDKVEINKYLVPSFGFEVKDIRHFFDKVEFNEKKLKEVFDIVNFKSKNKKKLPISKDVFYKPIPRAVVRSFVSGNIENNRKVDKKTVGKFEISRFMRNRITVINFHEDRRVDRNTGLLSIVLKEGRKKKDENSCYLGYQFYTDILVINPPPVTPQLTSYKQEAYYSLLYAILEGASEALDIKREDIDGTIYRTEDNESRLIIYDNVPAGAGFITEIYENFEDVLDKALEIVSNCSCGEDSCCPSCLLSYSNQYFADLLQRRFARDLIEIGKAGVRG
ncbi:Helicase conserved C-terminal domain-containing protein [Desulfurobacterium pacificum]|uniref:Helicase conserved C-terminal domain-containing protein n=1 Tax=Desulfurobacterium pacificum TaxID=240166 RepID=A0ABY1NQB3_9BACT|nr:DEAD/DEAH box helicase [Desulfurobacterium pacificum]SMP15298.1 Helicase conserved C-terminal domain-containing protein [Desulfurobacterium pacificum]